MMGQSLKNSPMGVQMNRNRNRKRHERCGTHFTVMGCLGAAVLTLGLAWPAQAEQIRIGGTGGALATMQLLADAYASKHPAATFTVLPSMGSSGGIKAVLSGDIQVAVSARALKDNEIAQGARQVEFGRTPFVFVTSALNKVDDLGLRELVDIYAGKTEQWPDGKRIRLVLRPVGDSDSDMVKSLSPEMRDAKLAAEQRKGMPFAVTDQDAADSLEKIPGALGPSTLAQILTEKRRLKALKVDGIEPSAKNVESGRYPWYKTMYLITAPKATPVAQEFVQFVQSEAGRRILSRHGYAIK